MGDLAGAGHVVTHGARYEAVNGAGQEVAHSAGHEPGDGLSLIRIGPAMESL